MDVTVREIEIADADAAAQLSGQLGYPVETAVMAQRIAGLDRSTHSVLVASSDGEIVGWIDVGAVQHLQSGVYAEIGGLVVSDACRSKGIGARLVAAAESWAVSRGIEKMLVRSQIKREAAHRFYLREGYEQTKTSAVFTKTLRSGTSTPPG